MLDRIDNWVGDLTELTFNVLALGVMGISGKAVYEGVKEKSWTDLPTTALPFLVSAWWVSQQPWHSTTPIEIVNHFKADVDNALNFEGDDEWDDCCAGDYVCDECDECPECCDCWEDEEDEDDED